MPKPDEQRNEIERLQLTALRLIRLINSSLNTSDGAPVGLFRESTNAEKLKKSMNDVRNGTCDIKELSQMERANLLKNVLRELQNNAPLFSNAQFESLKKANEALTRGNINVKAQYENEYAKYIQEVLNGSSKINQQITFSLLELLNNVVENGKTRMESKGLGIVFAPNLFGGPPDLSSNKAQIDIIESLIPLVPLIPKPDFFSKENSILMDAMNEPIQGDNKPVFQFAKDITRGGFKIGNIEIVKDSPLFKSAKALLENRDDDLSKDAFIKSLTGNLQEVGFNESHIKNLLNTYSQKFILGTGRMIGAIQKDGMSISFSNVEHNLFLDDGEMYFESTITGVYQKDPWNATNHLKDYKGEVKSVFKITEHGPEAERCSMDAELYEQFQEKIHESPQFRTKVQEVVIKNLAMNVPPSTVLAKVDELYEDKTENREIKKQLCLYQIEHAYEIYAKQVEKAKSVSTATPLEKKGEPSSSPSDSKKATDDKGVIGSPQAKVAYDLLNSIQDTILSTKWKVGPLGGKKYKTDSGDAVPVRLPKNMKEMMDVIKDAKKRDPNHEKPEVWVNAMRKVNSIGIIAADSKGFSIGSLGKRDDKTQEFYTAFSKAYKEKAKQNLEPNAHNEQETTKSNTFKPKN